MAGVLVAPAVLGVGLGGCREFASHRRELERLAATGRYERAAEVLDAEREDVYRRDRLLWQLERGAVALANNDPDAAIEHLEDAERMIDLKREAGADEVVATWLVGERSGPYLAEPYEDLYVNVLKLLAQLEAGRIDGYATVEARRLAWKSDHLRDRAEAWARSLDEAAQDKVGSSPSGVDTEEEGEFIESPLGTYLSALAFMEAGEGQMQAVAGRRLMDTLSREGTLVGDVDASRFEGVETMRPEDADVLVVALSGRGPTKVADRVGPIIIYTVPIYFELPRMVRHPSEVASVSVEVEGYGEQRLDLIEDMAEVAVVNHERYLPLVYTRTLIRAAAKATTAAVAAEAARDNDSEIGVVAAVLGGLLFMAATEEADLRCWVFLPGQARVATLDLPEGTHRVRTIYRGSGGGEVYATGWREVEVREGRLATVVDHYWR